MRRIFFILIYIISSVTAYGQALTFSLAEEMMLSGNLEIQTAREVVRLSEIELKAMRGLRYPNIDFMGGYMLMQRDVEIDLGGSKGALSNATQHIINEGVDNGIISPGVAEFIASGISPLLAADWSFILQKRSAMLGAVSLVQPIYMGGKINAAIASAEIEVSSARYKLQATINRKLTELVELYYGVIIAQMAVDLRQKSVDGLRNHLEDAQALEQEGMIPNSEVLYVKYKLSESERDLHLAHSKLTIAQDALSRLLGCNVNEKLANRIFIVETIYSLEYYIENGINLNPILLDVKSKIALSEQGVNIARAELLPQVAAFGGAIVASHNLTELMPRWNIGVGMQLNIFDGLGKERRLMAAKQANRVAHTAINDAESEIRLLINNEYYSVINSLYDVSSCNSTIEFTRSYLQAKSEGFKEGLTPSSEVVDAQIALCGAELERSVAAFSFCKSLARLLEASGLSHTFNEYQEKAIFM